MEMSHRRQFFFAFAALVGCGVCAAVYGNTNPPHTSSLYALERPGSPPTVLFIHGFGQSTVYWQEWVELLSDCGIHAIAVDLPGFGQSAHAAGPYTIKGLADAVAQFIQDRKLGAVTLVGSSMGSTVAQFVTLRHPRLVRRLLLTATSANPPPRTSAPLDPAAARNFWATRDIKAMVDGFFATKAPPAAKASAFYEAGHQMTIDAAIEATESNLNWTTLERLWEIKVPVLIIQGRHDSAKSPEQGELMARRMPHAQLVVLANSAHTPQWDEPQEFKRVALPFLLAGRKSSGSCKKEE
jgi:pimeloyl-ACP methyl ester carboxylesterase